MFASAFPTGEHVATVAPQIEAWTQPALRRRCLAVSISITFAPAVAIFATLASACFTSPPRAVE